MNSLKFWHLCEELTVHQAACLIVGGDPSEDVRPPGYGAAMAALTNAITNGRIPGIIRYAANPTGWVEFEVGVNWAINDKEVLTGDKQWIVTRSPDWNLSTVSIAGLRSWLASRQIGIPSFFAESSATPDYLDRAHRRYAPKLAAAVSAWRAMEAEPMNGRTPKQLLAKWLRENAAQFDMTDEDGKPFEEAVENCAKVANWQPGGGAPKTPTG